MDGDSPRGRAGRLHSPYVFTDVRLLLQLRVEVLGYFIKEARKFPYVRFRAR